MPTTYEITAPDGVVYEVTGDGTEQEALAEFQKQWKANGGAAQPQAKGFLEDPGGYLSATYNNFTDPEQWKHALTETPEAKAVMNPGQSIPDLARSMGNFTSLGATDRLRSGLYGTDIADEVRQTDEASSRLGSIDEAANLGTAFLQPSAASKYLPAGTGMVKSALAHGAEQAGMAGTQAAMEGKDILPAMGVGGAFGAGGSVLADATGSVANIFSKKANPQFKDEADLFAKEKITPKNTRLGKDMARRAQLAEQFRLAETKGMKGLGAMSEEIEAAGRQPGIPREFYEGVSKMGNQGNKSAMKKAGWGNILRGGGGWGTLGALAPTLGLGPMVGAGFDMASKLAGDVNPKMRKQVMDQLLQGSGGAANPNMTPEMVNELRNYLAKMGGAKARQ